MIGGRSASASSKPAHAASPPHTAGQITPRPAARAAIAAGSTPGTRLQRAVERQLAQHDVARDAFARHHAHRCQKAKRDRQVVVAAFLGEVGRREVDGDALRRQGKAERAEGGAHTLAAFAHRLVGQADHGKGEIARRHQDLHIDRQDIDALESHGPHLCLHAVLRDKS